MIDYDVSIKQMPGTMKACNMCSKPFDRFVAVSC